MKPELPHMPKCLKGKLPDRQKLWQDGKMVKEKLKGIPGWLHAWFFRAEDTEKKAETPAAEPARAQGGRLWRAAHAMTKRGWLTLGLVLFLAAVTTGFFLTESPSGVQRAAYDADTAIYYTVKPGASTRDIAADLARRGVLNEQWKFWLLARTGGYAEKFQAGTYALRANMTAEEVAKKLSSGETTEIRFTIPEGFGVKEIAKRLDDEGIADEQEFLRKAKDFTPYDYVEENPEAHYACEGFLFPDTYILHETMSVDDILKMMARDFDHRLTPEMRAKAASRHLSIYQLITLASLVEKEARFAEDRPIIAQVFFKRLALGMPLQTDTTLQYLMDGPKEDVSLEDTRIDSPYNTYQHRGLPPGPIANPGMAAIEAVLNPADTDYLYFVADRQGHNHYATNYEDHLALVNQYR